MADWYRDSKFTSGKPLKRSIFWTVLALMLVAAKFAIAFWLVHN